MRFKVLPELIDEKANSVFPKRMRIWSTACSTGQEAYSLAIAIVETIPDVEQWDIQIVGTDISPAAVAKASRGIYSKLEIGLGMDSLNLRKHFVECDGGWQVQDRIRAMCCFSVRNLHEPFSGIGMFDVIFCRNVAIYFSEADRRSIFERMADTLAPNGWVFVGSSESLNDLGDPLEGPATLSGQLLPSQSADSAACLAIRRGKYQGVLLSAGPIMGNQIVILAPTLGVSLRLLSTEIDPL